MRSRPSPPTERSRCTPAARRSWSAYRRRPRSFLPSARTATATSASPTTSISTTSSRASSTTRRRSSTRPDRVSLLPGNPASDGLGLQILLEALDSALPPHAAVLVAAERRIGTVEHPAVDAEGPGADAAGDVHSALHRPRDDRARQSERAVIGDADRVVVVVERHHDQHRTEDLVLSDRSAVLHADDQRGLHEVPALEVRRQVLDCAAAGDDLGTVASRPLHGREHTILLRGADHRADKGFRQYRIADGHTLIRGGDGRNGLVVERAVH